MNTEHNIEMAKEYLKAVGNRDTKAIEELMIEDATWWIIPGTKFSGLHQIKDLSLSTAYALQPNCRQL